MTSFFTTDSLQSTAAVCASHRSAKNFSWVYFILLSLLRERDKQERFSLISLGFRLSKARIKKGTVLMRARKQPGVWGLGFVCVRKPACSVGESARRHPSGLRTPENLK